MTSVGPDLDAEDLIGRISRGELPRDFMMFAAQGLLPLPQEELVAVLAHLARHEDGQIAALARTSVAELPVRVVAGFCSSEKARHDQLGSLAGLSLNPSILEAIVRNRNTSDETIELLARVSSPSIQEIIVINQERILRLPSIIDALLENSQVSPDVRRRALETREEFFEKKARREVEELDTTGLDVQDDLDLEPIAELLEKAMAEEQPANTLPMPELVAGDPDKESIWARVGKMTVAQRVQCAYKGGKTERGILVRDRNKLVCSAVVRSPRITETEIEAFAAMRNIEEDVLRIIGTNREYMTKYAIVHNLVRNPKAPIAIAMNIVGRLTLRDLKGLKDSKEVSEVIRVHARKLYQVKNKQQ